MNNIIFLDIDGVLNNYPFINSIKSTNPLDHLMKEKIDLLNQIILATNAKIVLSTNWRVSVGAAKTADLLIESGVLGNVIGSTPTDLRRHLSEVVPRHKEIQAWIDANLSKIKSFVIIDDLESASNKKLHNNFVLTDPDVGLTKENVQQAILILNSQI